MFFICRVTSRDRMFEGPCNFMDGKSSLYLTILASLVAIGIVVEEICF